MKKVLHLKSITDLNRGDIIVSKDSGNSYVISATCGDRAIAVDVIEITNPAEWMKVIFSNVQEENHCIEMIDFTAMSTEDIHKLMDRYDTMQSTIHVNKVVKLINEELIRRLQAIS